MIQGSKSRYSGQRVVTFVKVSIERSKFSVFILQTNSGVELFKT